MRTKSFRSFMAITLAIIMLCGTFVSFAEALTTKDNKIKDTPINEVQKGEKENIENSQKEEIEEKGVKEGNSQEIKEEGDGKKNDEPVDKGENGEKPKEKEGNQEDKKDQGPSKQDLELIKYLKDELVKLRKLEEEILNTPKRSDPIEDVILIPGEVEMEEPDELSDSEYSRIKKFSLVNRGLNKSIEIDQEKLIKVREKISEIESKLKELMDKYGEAENLLTENIETNDKNTLEIGPQLSTQSMTVRQPTTSPKKTEINVKWLNQNGTINNLHINQDWTNGSKDIRARVTYEIVGEEDEFKPGTVEISIPRFIYNDRNGTPIGEVTLSVPKFPSTKQPFSYIVKGRDIVFVNTRTLPRSVIGYLEVTYKSVSPQLVKDKATGEKSNFINASISRPNGENRLEVSSKNTLTTDVDTKAELTQINEYISHPYGYPYEVYPDTFPEELKPTNHEDYVYVDFRYNMSNYATQPYDVKFIAAALNHGGKIIGIRNSVDNETVVGEGKNILEIPIKTDNKFNLNRAINSMRIFVAYPKSEFTEQKEYKLELNGKYVLTSEDDKQVTTKDFTEYVNYTPIVFEPPKNHFWIDKQGDGKTTIYNAGKYEGIYSYALNALVLGKDVNITYRTRVLAFNLPFTYPEWKPEDEKESKDLSKYKQRNFTTEVTDGLLETKYKDWDYEIKSISIGSMSFYDYEKYTSSANGYYERKDGYLAHEFIPLGNYGYKAKGTLDDIGIADRSYNFQILGSADGKSYKPYGKVSIGSGISISGSNGATVENGELIFPKGVISYKTVLESGIPGYTYSIKPTITIKSNDKSKAFAEKLLEQDNPMERVRTDGSIIGKTDRGQEVEGNSDYAHNRLMGMVNGVRLIGDLDYSNDTDNSRVNISYILKMQNQTNQIDMKNIKEAADVGAFKEETQATWYVLLPKGVDLNINSIKVRSEDSIAERQLIKNFKGTGRDLLAVKLNQTPKYKVRFRGNSSNFIGADGYTDEPTISFEGKYPWVMMKQNEVRLPSGGSEYRLKLDAVYKSSNESLGSQNTFLGEDSSITKKQNRYTPSVVEEALKDIEGKDSNNSYLFTEVNRPITVDTSATIGVEKLVDVNNEKDYTSGTSYDDKKYVYENGYYSYRIIATNDDKTESANLVVYDKIDRYSLTEVKDTEFGANQFKGIFNGVDLSMAESLDIDPVIYYATDENIDISGSEITRDMNLKSSRWSTIKPKNSEITAVAIDLSRKKDGSKFLLGENQSIMAEIKMKAPSLKTAKKDSFAFNKSIVTFTSKSGLGSKVVSTEKTKIGIKPFFIKIKAEWDDDNDRDGKRPENITIKLVRNSKEIGDLVVLDSSNNLSHTFDNVEYQDEEGNIYEYTFRKAVANKDYRYILKSPKKFDDRLEYNLIVKHEPEKIDVQGEKIWKGKKTGLFTRQSESPANRPSSIKLKMYKNGEEYKTITVVPDKNNNWKFTSPNEYKYENKGQEIKYEFKEEDYIEGYIEPKYSKDGLTITNYYYPYGDLKVTKQLKDATKAAKEQSFKFEFKLETKNGDTLRENNNIYKYVTESGRKGEVSSGGTIEMKSLDGNPEYITIKDLPSGSKVTLTEVDKPGFKATKKTQSVDIKSGREAMLEFENTYSTKGEVVLKANKEVVGKTLEPFRFLFDLVDSNGTTIQSIRNDAEGKIYFELLKYTLKDIDPATSIGKFEYTIKERNDKLPGYKYDSKEYKVIVSLKDNGDGTITATPEYKLNGTTVESAKFTNEYKAKADLSITTYKSIKYTTLKPAENSITYGLYDDKGKQISTAKNDKNGKISFKVADYFNEKDHNTKRKFTLKEIGFDMNLFEPNKETLVFESEIKDNGEGSMSVTNNWLGRFNGNTKVSKADENIPQLINKAKTGSIQLTKKVNGDYHDPNKLFKFKIKFTGDKDNIPKELKIVREDSKVNIHEFPNPIRPSEEYEMSIREELGLENFIGPLEYNVLQFNLVQSGNQNVILKDEKLGYEVLEDPTDSNAIILNVTNSYADGLNVIYNSNNGETKSYRKEYKPKDLLTDNDKFPANTENWGNPGLIIKGWSTDSKATKPDYKVNEIIKNTNIYDKRSKDENTLNEVNLYAVWGKPGFAIIFNSNGGEGSMGKQTVEYDNATELSPNKFYKQGKRFIGWSTTPTGKVEFVDKFEIKKSESEVTDDNLKLYAVWEDSNLNLKSDNGEFEFTLKENEIALIDNIPGYLEYEITEIPDPAWGLVSTLNPKGTIVPSTISNSEFTNKYGAKSVQYIAKGIKNINGKPGSIDSFEFKLTDITSVKSYTTKANNDTGEFSFEPIIFNKPGTYKMQLQELPHNEPSYTTDSKIYNFNVFVEENGGNLTIRTDAPELEFNNKVKKAKIVVKKLLEGEWLNRDKSFDFVANINGIKTNFTLKENETKEFGVNFGDSYEISEIKNDFGDWVIISDNKKGIVDSSIENVVFTNRSKLNINNDIGSSNETISFNKKLIGRELEDKEFKFNLDFKDSSGTVIRNITLSNDSTGLVESELSSLLFKKATKLEISEVVGEDDTITYDNTNYVYNISYTDSNLEIKDSDGNLLKDLVITNKVKPGHLNIKLNVRNVTDMIKDKEFTIKAKIGDKIKSYTLKNGQTQRIEVPSGTSYEIIEDDLPEGFNLVNILKGSGDIGVNQTINVELNIEYILKASYTPTAKKKILDADGNESEELLKQYLFNYVLLNGEDGVIGRAQNDELGNILFTGINYSADDIGKTFKYKMAELEDGQYGISFDKSQYNIEVTVSDTGRGLSLDTKISRILNEETVEVTEIEFINKYRVPIDAPITGYKKSLYSISMMFIIIISAAYLLFKK